MRTTVCKTAFSVVAVMVLFSLASCSNNPSSWYPSGVATIVSWYESSVSGNKVCMITLKIENTGRSTISASTVSLSAKTDVRIYYKTIAESFIILPGKSAYVDVEIEYESNTEALDTNGLSLVDEYYQ
jgi:hypothetical protein